MIENSQFLDPPKIDGTRATICAMDDIALFQKIRQICTILTRYPSDNCSVVFHE